MAFSAVTARGSVTSGSNSTTTSLSPTANLTVGKIVFVCSVTDNSATVDGPSDRHSISDTQGHTWTKVTEYTETDGAADDGVCVSIFFTKVTTQINTTDTITLTTVATQSDKIVTCFEVTVGAGNTVASAGVGVGQGSLSTSISGLTSREYLFVYLFGSEGEDAAKTPPTSYTELFDLVSSTAGALDANVQIEVATRIQTTTSSGTVAASAVTGTNLMSVLAAMYETADIPPPSQITGSTAGTSTVSSTLIGVGVLSGTSAGTSNIVAVLTEKATVSPITGSTSGSTTLSSSITGKGTLTGTIAGVASVSSLLSGKGVLIATVAGTSSISSTLKGRGSLSGTVAGTSSLVGTIREQLTTTLITGAASGLATVSAIIRGIGSLTGTLTNTSSTTATLRGKGILSGTVITTSSSSGTIYGKGSLSGSTGGNTTLTAIFVGTIVDIKHKLLGKIRIGI